MLAGNVYPSRTEFYPFLGLAYPLIIETISPKLVVTFPTFRFEYVLVRPQFCHAGKFGGNWLIFRVIQTFCRRPRDPHLTIPILKYYCFIVWMKTMLMRVNICISNTDRGLVF